MLARNKQVLVQMKISTAYPMFGPRDCRPGQRITMLGKPDHRYLRHIDLCTMELLPTPMQWRDRLRLAYWWLRYYLVRS